MQQNKITLSSSQITPISLKVKDYDQRRNPFIIDYKDQSILRCDKTLASHNQIQRSLASQHLRNLGQEIDKYEGEIVFLKKAKEKSDSENKSLTNQIKEKVTENEQCKQYLQDALDKVKKLEAQNSKMKNEQNLQMIVIGHKQKEIEESMKLIKNKDTENAQLVTQNRQYSMKIQQLLKHQSKNEEILQQRQAELDQLRSDMEQMKLDYEEQYQNESSLAQNEIALFQSNEQILKESVKLLEREIIEKQAVYYQHRETFKKELLDCNTKLVNQQTQINKLNEQIASKNQQYDEISQKYILLEQNQQLISQDNNALLQKITNLEKNNMNNQNKIQQMQQYMKKPYGYHRSISSNQYDTAKTELSTPKQSQDYFLSNRPRIQTVVNKQQETLSTQQQSESKINIAP